MPVSLTYKKMVGMKISSILPITFFLCTFPSLSSSFCASLPHTLGHTSQNAIISSF